MTKIPGLNKRNIALSVGFITLVILIIMLKTTSKETLHALWKANLSFLLLAFLAWMMYIVFDGLRFSLAALSINEHRLDLLTAIKIITIGIFLAAVSPFQVAGLPVQILLMNKRRIGVGKSTALLASRGFISYITILISVLISLKFIWPPPSNVIKGIIVYASILVGAVLLTYSFAIFAPHLIKKIIKSEKINREILSLRETTILLVTNSNKKTLFLALLASFMCHIGLVLTTFFTAKAFNSPMEFMRAFSFQSLIQGGLLWTPTPGGTGIAEGIGLVVFKDAMDKDIIGLFVLLWRFFTHHFAAILGALFLIAEFRDL